MYLLCNRLFFCFGTVFETNKIIVNFLLNLTFSEAEPGQAVERIDPGQRFPGDLVLGDTTKVGSTAVEGIIPVVT